MHLHFVHITVSTPSALHVPHSAARKLDLYTVILTRYVNKQWTPSSPPKMYSMEHELHEHIA